MSYRNVWLKGFKTRSEATKFAKSKRKETRKNFYGKTVKKYTRVFTLKNKTNVKNPGYSVYGRIAS